MQLEKVQTVIFTALFGIAIWYHQDACMIISDTQYEIDTKCAHFLGHYEVTCLTRAIMLLMGMTSHFLGSNLDYHLE